MRPDIGSGWNMAYHNGIREIQYEINIRIQTAEAVLQKTGAVETYAPVFG